MSCVSHNMWSYRPTKYSVVPLGIKQSVMMNRSKSMHTMYKSTTSICGQYGLEDIIV